MFALMYLGCPVQMLKCLVLFRYKSVLSCSDVKVFCPVQMLKCLVLFRC